MEGEKEGKDMEYETVTQQEFEALGKQRRRGPYLPETIALAKLQPLTGMKVPCHWNHTGKSKHCGGISTLHSAAKRYGFKVNFACRDKVVYAFRYE